MLDIGWSEYLFIGILALILLGPKELPVVLRTLGAFVAKVRRLTASLQDQLYTLENTSKKDEETDS